MTLIEKLPDFLALHLPPTLGSAAVVGLLQVGSRCLSFSVLNSCLLGGVIYVASKNLNEFVQRKFFDANNVEYNNLLDWSKQSLIFRGSELLCKVLTGAVMTLIFEAVAAGGSVAIFPALATGALIGVVLYTASKVAVFVFKDYKHSIYNNLETFFRWVTWQTWADEDYTKQNYTIQVPICEFTQKTNELIDKIKERTYPQGTKKLKKKNPLAMMDEVPKRERTINKGTIILESYTIKNPWADDSDNPHDPLHKENYIKAKEVVEINIKELMKEVDEQIKTIKEKAEVLKKEQKPKIPKIQTDIDEVANLAIRKLISKKIELKIELEAWKEVGGEPLIYQFNY